MYYYHYLDGLFFGHSAQGNVILCSIPGRSGVSLVGVNIRVYILDNDHEANVTRAHVVELIMNAGMWLLLYPYVKPHSITPLPLLVLPNPCQPTLPLPIPLHPYQTPPLLSFHDSSCIQNSSRWTHGLSSQVLEGQVYSKVILVQVQGCYAPVSFIIWLEMFKDKVKFWSCACILKESVCI